MSRVQSAALRYGFQSGLAYGTHLINQAVRSHAKYLTKVYDFGAVMIDGPYGTKILPPVIVSSHHLYRQIGSDTVVIADKRYHILNPAAFAPVQPMWQTYLIQPWQPAQKPPREYFPQNAREDRIWRKSIAKGFLSGERDALQIFKVNNHRLETAFVGMVRWSRLVVTHMATTPQVVASMKPVVGNGVTVTINKGEVRIIQGARLNAN